MSRRGIINSKSGKNISSNNLINEVNEKNERGKGTLSIISKNKKVFEM